MPANRRALFPATGRNSPTDRIVTAREKRRTQRMDLGDPYDGPSDRCCRHLSPHGLTRTVIFPGHGRAAPKVKTHTRHARHTDNEAWWPIFRRARDESRPGSHSSLRGHTPGTPRDPQRRRRDRPREIPRNGGTRTGDGRRQFLSVEYTLGRYWRRSERASTEAGASRTTLGHALAISRGGNPPPDQGPTWASKTARSHGTVPMLLKMAVAALTGPTRAFPVSTRGPAADGATGRPLRS